MPRAHRDDARDATAVTAIGIERLPYRQGVGMMLLNPAGEVLVAQRVDMPSEAWQMPQGGIDVGETPEAAAWREMQEEIGTGAATMLAESCRWYRYDLPPELVPRLWQGRFRGQEQKWFAFRFTGADADITIDSDHAEFSRWKWTAMASLPSLIVPFKRQLYVDLVAEFGHLAAPNQAAPNQKDRRHG